MVTGAARAERMGDTAIWAFARVLRAHWFAAMSGGFSVPFTAAMVYFDSKYAQSIFGALALASLWFAAYRIWKGEHDKVVALEAMLEKASGTKPKNIRNVSLGEAVSYVSFREWGRTFMEAIASQNAPLVKANQAYDYFLQALADGEIPVWGKKFQGEVHAPIENNFWFNNRLDFLSLTRKESATESSDHMGTKATSYTDLMTSREAVEAYWPRVGDTGVRAVSALHISFGMDHSFKSAKTRNLHQYERIYSFKLTNRGPKTLSECRVIVESVDADTGIVFPQTLAETIRLAPGDHVFVPIVSYGEPMNIAHGDAGDTFTCLATPEPQPFFDVGENVLVKLRATGIDTLPHEAQCRMWVDEKGRLQIQDE
jgi:hypothetical protein